MDVIRRVPPGPIDHPISVEDDAKLAALDAAIEAGELLEIELVAVGPRRWRVARFGVMSYYPMCPDEGR
jgi:hypothetical protein